MLVESTNQVFFKAFTPSIPVGVHKCNMRLGEQKSQLLLRWADRIPPTCISEGQCPTFGCGKIAIFQNDCSPIHDLVTLLYWTLKSVLG